MTRNKEAQAAMSARKLFYLGPQGTFTHQAAVNAAQELARLEPQGFDLMPMDDVPQILDAAQHGDGWGIVAWENNVEGYVVPNLDALIDAYPLPDSLRRRNRLFMRLPRRTACPGSATTRASTAIWPCSIPSVRCTVRSLTSSPFASPASRTLSCSTRPLGAA